MIIQQDLSLTRQLSKYQDFDQRVSFDVDAIRLNGVHAQQLPRDMAEQGAHGQITMRHMWDLEYSAMRRPLRVCKCCDEFTVTDSVDGMCSACGDATPDKNELAPKRGRAHLKLKDHTMTPEQTELQVAATACGRTVADEWLERWSDIRANFGSEVEDHIAAVSSRACVLYDDYIEERGVHDGHWHQREGIAGRAVMELIEEGQQLDSRTTVEQRVDLRERMEAVMEAYVDMALDSRTDQTGAAA